MRFYALGNMYLSSIQQGIQAGHALGEIVAKYEYSAAKKVEQNIVKDFLTNHKTWVLLNGGTWEEITEFAVFLNSATSLKYPIPYSSFHEDAKSLAGIVTCVGLILPKEYYEAVPYKKLSLEQLKRVPYVTTDEDYFYFDDPEISEVIGFAKSTQDWELINRIKSCPLAR